MHPTVRRDKLGSYLKVAEVTAGMRGIVGKHARVIRCCECFRVVCQIEMSKRSSGQEDSVGFNVVIEAFL